jgi:hypothetical protein
MRSALLTSTLLTALVLAGACAQAEPLVIQDIVSTIPWPDRERAEYILLDRDSGDEEGRGVLSVTRKDNQFELQLRFESEGDSDESVVLVDAITLKPTSVRRELRREDEVIVMTGDYDPEEGIVQIIEIRDGNEREIPLRLEEPYYNNDESLFLWRTIPFEEGYKASYNAVLVNRGALTLITVEVAGKEEVTVPAGVFQAWRVEIRIGDVRQVAWYADTPEHLLVQYDNTRHVFQLTEFDGG